MGSGANSPAVREGLPELGFVRALEAAEHRLCRLPATEFAEHLERLVHQVRGKLPPQRVRGEERAALCRTKPSGGAPAPATGSQSRNKLPHRRIAVGFRVNCRMAEL